MKIHCPELPKNLKEETEWAGLEAWAREEEAELIGVNFSHTSLSGVDLTQCRLEGIRIAGGELKGAVVTPYQAAELALLLGVVIRQE